MRSATGTSELKRENRLIHRDIAREYEMKNIYSGQTLSVCVKIVPSGYSKYEAQHLCYQLLNSTKNFLNNLYESETVKCKLQMVSLSLWNWMVWRNFENCTTNYISAFDLLQQQQKQQQYTISIKLLLRSNSSVYLIANLWVLWLNRKISRFSHVYGITIFLSPFLKNKWLLCLHFTLHITAYFGVFYSHIERSSSTTSGNFRLQFDCHQVDPFSL